MKASWPGVKVGSSCAFAVAAFIARSDVMANTVTPNREPTPRPTVDERGVSFILIWKYLTFWFLK